MSNIYLNITIEKKLRSQNFDFSKFKKFAFRSGFEELQLTQIQTSFCNLKIRALGEKLCAAFQLFSF